MKIAYKYRMYPNKKQKEFFQKTLGCCRFIFNYFLEQRITSYKEEGKSLSNLVCSAELTKLKKEKEWLQEVDAVALQQTLRDLDVAYKSFFTRLKKGNVAAGFPKFKSKRNSKQTYRTHNIVVGGNYIKLPKIGKVKCRISRLPKGNISSCTISFTNTGKYFVSVLSKEEKEKLEVNESVIGIDLGLKEFLVTSEGEVVDNLRLTKKYERKLAKLQRKLAHKKKGSNNYKRCAKRIALLHEKIGNTRKDFLHKLSKQIINENQVIICEKLNVAGMLKNHNLAKAISDVSWSEFVEQLQYKSIWYSRVFTQIDTWFPSSQLCNVCGNKNKDVKNLSIRNWVCNNCGTKHDRDVNAAINIRTEGLKILGQELSDVRLAEVVR